MAAYAKKGNPEAVQRLLREILGETGRLVPSVRTYTTLLDAHLKAGDSNSVFSVFKVGKVVKTGHILSRPIFILSLFFFGGVGVGWLGVGVELLQIQKFFSCL